MRPTKYERIFSLFFITVIVLLMMVVVFRFMAKNVIYDIMQVRGPFIEFLLGDVLNNEDIGVIADWESIYPFDEKDAMSSLSITSTNHEESKVKAVIREYCTSYVFLRDIFVRMNCYLKEALNFHMLYTTESATEVLVMNNDYYTYAEPKKEVLAASQSIDRLYEYTNSMGIDFIYIQTPSKTDEEDKQLDAGLMEYTNENVDHLIENLEIENVPYLDFRKILKKRGGWYDSFYKTDHHWTTRTQLWATGVLEAYLNEVYDYNFDIEQISGERYQYNCYEKSYIGAQGRKLADTQKEDFELVLPNFQTSFDVSIPADGINIYGDYSSSMIDYEKLSALRIKDEAYESIRVFNEQLAHIHNCGKVNNEKTFLVITDSFGAWITSYLALDIRNIDVMHPSQFTGSIETYIEREHPDLVMVMLTPCNIDEADMSKHTNVYDFR